MSRALRLAADPRNTATDSVRLLPVAARAFKPGQLDAIFRAARALSERALVACEMPRHPDLREVTTGCDRDIERAISDLMEAING
jgi:hypothetical protein